MYGDKKEIPSLREMLNSNKWCPEIYLAGNVWIMEEMHSEAHIYPVSELLLQA